MRQVSVSYSTSLPCHVLACRTLPCHHLHFISCHHVHRICIRVRLMHPSIFPVVRFAIRHSYVPRRPFCLFSCAGVKRSRNGPRFAKRPWYTTGKPPVKFRAIWSPFDTPTVNRVTIKVSFVCSPTPPSKWPKTHLSHLHPLGRSITIVLVKTAHHLELPSSFYLYICVSPQNFGQMNPSPAPLAPPDMSVPP